MYLEKSKQDIEGAAWFLLAAHSKNMQREKQIKARIYEQKGGKTFEF